jgi:hypothetical protein
VRWLLKKGADPNLSDRKGATPLHMAVMRKRVKMIKILVSYGADLRKTSDWGTPLQLATQIGKSNPGLLPALLGANVKEESRSKIGVENEDPKEFMKRTIVKQLVKLQVKLSSIPTAIATTTSATTTNISSTGGTSSSSPPSSSSSSSAPSPSPSSLDDLLFSTQNDVSNLIDTITNWIQKNNSKASSSSSAGSTNGNTTQVLSSDELILAIGKGITNKKPTVTGKSVSPRTEGVMARRATVAEPPNASWMMLTGEESQAKIPSIGSYVSPFIHSFFSISIAIIHRHHPSFLSPLSLFLLFLCHWLISFLPPTSISEVF